MKTRKSDQNGSSVEVIDRNSYEPAYAQLANILRRQVAAGVFRPGDQLPSEAMLCQSYQVSPMTVRRTINVLAEEGVVSTARGRGTFVAGESDEAQMAQLREKKLRSILQTSLNEAQHLGYSPDEVAAAFHREFSDWLQENGQEKEE